MRQIARTASFVVIAIVVACLALVGCASAVSGTTHTSTATTTSLRSGAPGCPHTRQELPSPTQTPGGSLPTILPTRLNYVVLCRYGPYPSAELINAITITSATDLAALRTQVNKLVPLSPADAYPCPLDNGARIDAYFGSSGRSLELRFDLRGCQFITGSNAAYYGLSNSSQRLLATVEALVP
jgi:hypothetical protein